MATKSTRLRARKRAALDAIGDPKQLSQYCGGGGKCVSLPLVEEKLALYKVERSPLLAHAADQGCARIGRTEQGGSEINWVRRCSSGDGPRRTRSRDWITHAGMRARAEMAHGRRLVLTRGLALAGDLGRRCARIVGDSGGKFGVLPSCGTHDRIFSKVNPCLAM